MLARFSIRWKTRTSPFKTHNLVEARQFYIDQLGFEHISNLPQSLFISTQHYHHHIAVNTWQSNQVNPDNKTLMD